MLAARHSGVPKAGPAQVRWQALPEGHRHAKFDALPALTLNDAGWQDCPTDGRAPFLPVSGGAWAAFPSLESLFLYNGSGVMPGRTWVIAPDAESLQRRWVHLVQAPASDKERLFHPHLRNGKPGDKHVQKIVGEGSTIPRCARRAFSQWQQRPNSRPAPCRRAPIC